MCATIRLQGSVRGTAYTVQAISGGGHIYVTALGRLMKVANILGFQNLKASARNTKAAGRAVHWVKFGDEMMVLCLNQPASSTLTLAIFLLAQT